MVLAQVIIRNPSYHNYYIGPLNGEYDIDIVGISYVDEKKDNVHNLIEYRSNTLKEKYGNTNGSFIHPSKATHFFSLSFPHSFKNVKLNNYIDFALYDITDDTNIQPVDTLTFVYAILNLEIKPSDSNIAQNFSQYAKKLVE